MSFKIFFIEINFPVCSRTSQTFPSFAQANGALKEEKIENSSVSSAYVEENFLDVKKRRLRRRRVLLALLSAVGVGRGWQKKAFLDCHKQSFFVLNLRRGEF